jgi:peptidoglycan/LPS O-acetylase OafA/YrhL
MGQPESTAKPEMKQRLEYLDGLRGVAIFLVVLFHSYVRWPELVGHQFAESPLAQGKMGVELFFMISGFVIFMSLDRSHGIADFMWRRWLRLFPAMLAVTVFVFLTASLLPRPMGQPVLRDLLPGLTFIEPSGWEWLIGSPQGMLEGSFWSLFVEVKFYLFVCLVYNLFNGWVAIIALVAVSLAPPLIHLFGATPPAVGQVAESLDSSFWLWFAAGALHYKFALSGKRILFALGLVLSLLAAFRIEPQFRPGAIGVALLFAAAQLPGPLRALLASRPLFFLGSVSYPFYLMHENMMVGMIVSLRAAAPWIPIAALPALPFALVLTLAWVVANHVEPPLRQMLVRMRGTAGSAPNPGR